MNVNGFVCSILIACIAGFGMDTACAQVLPDNVKINPDTLRVNPTEDFSKQRDLVDIAFFILHKKRSSRVDSLKQRRNMFVSAAPIVEYTIATGFSPGIAGNIAFKNSGEEYTNTSSLLGAIKYTQKKQFLLPVQTSFWTLGNRYNFLGDWRFFNYSQDIYGLGGHTRVADKYVVTYKYLRLYEFALKSIGRNLYAGPGYKLDYHWNITEPPAQTATESDFKKYGFSQASVSSGISFTFL